MGKRSDAALTRLAAATVKLEPAAVNGRFPKIPTSTMFPSYK